MSDVRLTITDPSTGEVYPVAGNEKGELKLEEPILVEGPQGEKGDKGDPGDPFSGNFAGDVTFGAGLTWGSGSGTLSDDGSATFIGGDFEINTSGNVGDDPLIRVKGVTETSWISIKPTLNSGHAEFDEDKWSSINCANFSNVTTHMTFADGSAFFQKDVVVGSRGQTWMIVESNGLAHLVSQTFVAEQGVRVDEYPELRNIPGEIDQHKQVLELLRAEVQKIEEKLRIVPEAGWDVWDGSD